MNNIFLKEKGKGILLSLARRDQQYVSEIALDIRGTYAHTFNLLRKMEDLGIISTVKEGRTKYVKLTSKGERLAALLQEFDAVLKEKKAGKKVIKTTPSHEKLRNYQNSLSSMLREVKSKKLRPKERAKKARVLGRYRSLALKLRPRDKLGKELKTEVNSLIQNIDEVLSTYRKA
jgi:DNA-binding MarR family transcriptional regulator